MLVALHIAKKAVPFKGISLSPGRSFRLAEDLFGCTVPDELPS
jgi:hypothetical protein